MGERSAIHNTPMMSFTSAGNGAETLVNNPSGSATGSVSARAQPPGPSPGAASRVSTEIRGIIWMGSIQLVVTLVRMVLW